jgi:hypothetical protein
MNDGGGGGDDGDDNDENDDNDDHAVWYTDTKIHGIIFHKNIIFIPKVNKKQTKIQEWSWLAYCSNSSIHIA